MRVVHHTHHPVDVLLVDDNPGKPEHAPCGIVGMNRHINIVFVADRHNPFQEVFQVCEQLLVVDIPVHLKQLFHMSHSLRLPARHNRTVGVCGNGFKHLFRVKGVNCLLGIGEHRGAVGTHPCELGSRPVEHRHKIIAYQVNILLTQVFQCLNVIVNILLSLRHASLDRIVHVHALNPRYVKPRSLHLFLHGPDSLPAPNLSRRRVIQGGDNPLHPRYLADLLKRHRVKFGTIPAQCHLHRNLPSLL